MTEDDAELVALIDNELDESRRTALLARLAADEQLRQRYDELREAGAPIAASLDALLEQAPLARLRAALPPDGPVRQPSRRFGGIALRELAAGIVIGLLAAGAAAWVALSFGLLGEREDWRTAVVEYTNALHERDLQSFEPGRLAAGDRTERPQRQGGRQAHARKRGAPGPAIHGGVHALLTRARRWA